MSPKCGSQLWSSDVLCLYQCLTQGLLSCPSFHQSRQLWGSCCLCPSLPFHLSPLLQPLAPGHLRPNHCQVSHAQMQMIRFYQVAEEPIVDCCSCSITGAKPQACRTGVGDWHHVSLWGPSLSSSFHVNANVFGWIYSNLSYTFHVLANILGQIYPSPLFISSISLPGSEFSNSR